MNADFVTPPARNRVMPLWVWNGNVTEPRITEMLEQFAARGIGGVFIHPRPGLITEYLSERWFVLWGFALQECDRLGLECHIYDENSFPSGFAGGHVPAADPTTVAQHLVDGQLVPDAPQPFTAGFGYVDLALPQTTELFIQKTHEQYARHFQKEFGRRICYAFADEPELRSHTGLVWSEYFRQEFIKEHGYDPQSRLAAFRIDNDDSFAVRFDYFATQQRLFTANYLQPTYEWCDRRGLAFTGHFNEHLWPYPHSCPDVMAALRWMHVPGIDLLGFQFQAAGREQNGLYLLNLAELRSVANQLGRQRALCETCGGGGYHYTLADFKSLEDFALANGATLISPHLSYETLAGSRKYDFPQTFSDHSPWWNAYGLHADHLARVTTALLEGRENNRILVLQPTTTGWLHGRPPNENLPALDRIRTDQIALILTLQGQHFDFDLGDELILAELGQIADGRLQCGAAAYEVVVIPAAMENMLQSTLDLLEKFTASGGQVLSLREAPAFVNGRRRVVTTNWERCESLDRLREIVPPRFQAPPELCVMRKELPAGRILYFFANPWTAALEADVRIEAGKLTALDTFTGTSAPAGPCHLPARGHALWLVEPGERVSPAPEHWQEVATGPIRVERVRENVLVLDYCDWSGERDLPTILADKLNWEAQGFAKNLWSFGVQFKRNFLDAPIDPQSGFTVRYRFRSDAVRSVAIAIERPWLYRVTLNDEPVSFTDAVRWFDEDIRRVEVPVKNGENVIALTAQPFHVLCEIAPVYVLGDFATEPGAIRRAESVKLGDWTRQGLPFYPWEVRYRMPVTLPQPVSRLAVAVPEWAGSVIHVHWDGHECGVIAYPPSRLEWLEESRAGEHELTLEVVGNLKNLLGPHHADGVPGPWVWLNAPRGKAEYRFGASGLFGPPRVEFLQP